MLKSHQLAMTPLQFLDENGRPVKLIEPMRITLASELENYNKWLIAVVERINEALHPALPGKHDLRRFFIQQYLLNVITKKVLALTACYLKVNLYK